MLEIPIQHKSPIINLSFHHQLIIIFNQLQNKLANKMAQTRSRSRQREIEIEEEEDNLNEFQEALGGNGNDENPGTPTPSTIERVQHNPHFNRLFDEILRSNADAHFLKLAQEGAKLPSDFDLAQLRQASERQSRHEEERRRDPIRYNIPRGNPPPPPPNEMEMLRQQVENLAQQLHSGVKTNQFSLKDICPYPFDRNLYMPPFPRGFETPKFEKYRGKGDPRDHVREFHSACLEVTYEDTYLMRLFPKSLGGTTTSWFSRLPGGIRTFEELIQKFLSHYSYNIERDITMADLCNTKQKPGELFSVFLQRWRQMSSRRSLQLPE